MSNNMPRANFNGPIKFSGNFLPPDNPRPQRVEERLAGVVLSSKIMAPAPGLGLPVYQHDQAPRVQDTVVTPKCGTYHGK